MKKLFFVIFSLVLTLFLHENASSLCMFENGTQECSALALDIENEQQESENKCDVDDEKFHYLTCRLLTGHRDSVISYTNTLKSAFTFELLRPPKTA